MIGRRFSLLAPPDRTILKFRNGFLTDEMKGSVRKTGCKEGHGCKPLKILEGFKMVPQRAFQTGNRTSKKLNGVVHSFPETQSRRGLWFPNCVLMHPGAQQGNAVSVIDPVNTNSR